MIPPPPQPLPPPPPVSVDFAPPHHPNLPPAPPPPPPISSVLSNITSLLHLSTIALRSLPAPVAAAAAAASPAFLFCPFNPNHRLPPSSLFSHYLNCPSPLSLPLTFNYPLTLHSTTSSSVPVSLSATSSDVSVSLENYASHNPNFFYENCPGPVTSSIRPPSLLNLPRVLYIECADFNEDPPLKETNYFPVDSIRFLPSEIWTIRSETESWGGGLPAAYSPRILRVLLRLKDCNLSHLNFWIVSNSPRYSVIIDFPMRDHVVLLVRLCLKAIVREAFVSGGVMYRNGKLTNQSFECPILVKVMSWLALQFSVLYGDVNGKFFAVDVLKECISESALHASLFPLEQKDTVLRGSGEFDGNGEKVRDETVSNNTILISQVAAAVEALHERSLIEEKIKAARNLRPISAYERNMEHTYVSKMADEERLKRPDYRPIIDHDGFSWQRSSNQEGNKEKTREELLAEERDYKRRRMSYRGKKSKRNKSEVMRDIIEGYMEEIKQAGGIGDMSNTVEKTNVLGPEDPNLHSSTNSASVPRRNSEAPEENRGRSLDYRKELSEDFEDDIQRLRQDSSRSRGPSRSVERIRHDKDDYSGRRDGRSHRISSESREHKYHKRNRDERDRNHHEKERGERERTSHKSGRYKDSKDHGDIRGKKVNSNSRSHRELHKFDDRYDPSESYDFNDGEL